MQNSFEEIDTVAECLTEKCSDCTGFYVNRLFQHHLQCMHECHRIKDKVLAWVGGPASNTKLRVPDSPYHTNKENDTKYGFAEDKDKHFDGDSSPWGQ